MNCRRDELSHRLSALGIISMLRSSAPCFGGALSSAGADGPQQHSWQSERRELVRYGLAAHVASGTVQQAESGSLVKEQLKDG